MCLDKAALEHDESHALVTLGLSKDSISTEPPGSVMLQKVKTRHPTSAVTLHNCHNLYPAHAARKVDDASYGRCPGSRTTAGRQVSVERQLLGQGYTAGSASISGC